MPKTVIVCGYGPGISKAVAEKFAAEGFSVALVGRSLDRLEAAARELEKNNVKAVAIAAQLADAKSVREMVAAARRALGSIGAIVWTAYNGAAGDLVTADADAIHEVLDLPIIGLTTVVQEALPELRKDKGAVLVTNGGFGMLNPQMDAAAVQFGAMGLALANAAKHKLVRLLHEKLAKDGVYVGEVMVLGVVKGSAFDRGQGNLDPSLIAEKFWALYNERREVSVNVSG